MGVERFFCSSNERWMIGEAQIIVCAHVQHTFAPDNADMRLLGRCNHPLSFEKALRFNFLECLRKLLFEFGDHRTADYADIADSKSFPCPCLIRVNPWLKNLPNWTCQIVNNC